MSTDRIQVTLGPDVGGKSFKTFKEVSEWLAKEREFWDMLREVRSNTREAQIVWQPFEDCFRQLGEILNQLAAQEREAVEWRKRAESENVGEVQKQEFLRRADLDTKPFADRIKSSFQQFYQRNGVIPSISPRAKFVATVAKNSGPGVALFATGYLMRTRLDFGGTEMLEGALAASYFETGITDREPAETESLAELRRSWQDQFQKIHDDIATSAQRQSELNTETGAQHLKQQSEFADLIAKEKADWVALHKTYDENLALAKPVEFWKKKARSHFWLSWIFGIVALIAGGGVYWLLHNLFQETLRVPDGLKDPAAWHPEYWRLGVMIAAGIFGVWVIRILVRLFLSHVHLLADANERVTMAQTYLSLLRSDGGLPEKDRQLILQTLFRPASSGVVKDDGVPLSWIEAITKTGSK